MRTIQATLPIHKCPTPANVACVRYPADGGRFAATLDQSMSLMSPLASDAVERARSALSPQHEENARQMVLIAM